jgi:hypothetical protein
MAAFVRFAGRPGASLASLRAGRYHSVFSTLRPGRFDEISFSASDANKKAREESWARLRMLLEKN